jgi:SAM-dependent methyltransferase
MAAHSYDAIPGFGLLYDAVPMYAARRDVAFYVEEAERAGGPVLELGCGTGRVLIPIARAGHDVTGVDGSRAMLERCEAKVRGERADVQDRITLHELDVRDFGLGVTFPLVIAPFRVMQHLLSTDDQLRFLATVMRHLAPGGRFVFDVFNPKLSAMAAFDGVEREDTPETPLPDGRTVRRAARVAAVRWLEQVNDIELVYHVAPAAGARAERHVQAFPMRWYLRDELTHLLARSGFRIEAIHGDFDRTPLVDGAPEIVVHATPM